MAQPTRKQLIAGLLDAASNLDALTQDYGDAPDTDRLYHIPGIEYAIDLIYAEMRRLEAGGYRVKQARSRIVTTGGPDGTADD